MPLEPASPQMFGITVELIRDRLGAQLKLDADPGLRIHIHHAGGCILARSTIRVGRDGEPAEITYEVDDWAIQQLMSLT